MLLILLVHEYAIDTLLVGACPCSDCDCQHARHPAASYDDKHLDEGKKDAETVSLSLGPMIQSAY